MAVVFAAGGSVATVHLLTTLLAWFAGPVTAWYAAKRMSSVVAIAIGVVVSSHALNIGLGDTLLSEPLFTLMILLFALFIDRWGNRDSLKIAFLAGGLAAICFSLRSIGFAVWAGVLLGTLFRQSPRWPRRLVLCLATSVLPACYLVVVSLLRARPEAPSDAGYASQLFVIGTDRSKWLPLAFVQRLLRDAGEHFTNLLASLSPVHTEPGPVVLVITLMTLAVMALATVGWLRCFPGNRCVLAWTILCYLGVVFIWPHFYPRFTWPIVPLLYVFAIETLGGCVRDEESVTTSKRRLVTVCLLIGVALSAWLHNLNRPPLHRDQRAALMEAIVTATDYIRTQDNSPAPVIATLSDLETHYYLPQAKVVLMQGPFDDYVCDPAEQWKRIRENDVRWVLSGPGLTRYLEPLAKRHGDALQLVFETPDIRVWQVARTDGH